MCMFVSVLRSLIRVLRSLMPRFNDSGTWKRISLAEHNSIKWMKLLFVLIVVCVFIDYGLTPDLGEVMLMNFNQRAKPRNLANIDVIWSEYTQHGIRPEHVKCSKFFERDQSAIERYKNKSRLTLNQTFHPLNMVCDSVRLRIMGNSEYPKHRHNFAIARNVYRNYYIQELLLSFSFHPENYYCFAIDSKAERILKTSLIQLSNCLPNVIVLTKRYNFDSSGHFQDIAHLNCVDKLLEYAPWEYALLLQNDDVVIKSSGEISDIIESLEGAPLVTFAAPFEERVPKSINWTASALHLFKSGLNLTAEQAVANLTVVKSPNQLFLPRTFLTDVNEYLNLTTVTKVFNNNELYGVDEMLLASLVKSHQLGLAGQVENQCEHEDLVRFVHWNRDNTTNCWSGWKRHGVCILGVEYLHKLNSIPQIVANKVWPELDFGTIMCMGEIIYNRMQRFPESNLDLNVFKKLPQVRENMQKAEGTFDPSVFKC